MTTSDNSIYQHLLPVTIGDDDVVSTSAPPTVLVHEDDHHHISLDGDHPAASVAEIHHHDNTTYGGESDEVIPVVAPAMVLAYESSGNSSHGNDNRRGVSGGLAYSYPVATFVRELVRTGIDQLYASPLATNSSRPRGSFGIGIPTAASTGIIEPTTIQQDVPPEVAALSIPSGGTPQHRPLYSLDHFYSTSATTEVAALSIRSEPGNLALFREQGEQNTTNATMSSARSIDHTVLDPEPDIEYLLVDGELIAVPRQNYAEIEQEEIEHQIRQANRRSNQCVSATKGGQRLSTSPSSSSSTTTTTGVTTMSAQKSSKGGVVRGSLRKLGALFKRKKNSIQQQQKQNGPIEESNVHGNGTEVTYPSDLIHDQDVLRQTGQEDTASAATGSSTTPSVPTSPDSTIVPKMRMKSMSSPNRKGKRENQINNSSKRGGKGHHKEARRLSWRRTDSSGDDQEEENEIVDSPSEQKQQAIERFPPYPVQTGMVPLVPRISKSRRKRQPQSIDPLAMPDPIPNSAAAAAAGAMSADVHDVLPSMKPLPTLHGASGGSVTPSLSSASSSRAESVTATFVGTADHWAGVLPDDCASAVAYVESDQDASYWKKDDGSLVPSVVPRDVDYKVDKADAPDVESMLMRAANETTTDLDSYDSPWISRRGGKLEGSSLSSVPLSESMAKDEHVHNDQLKVVVVSAPDVDKSWVARTLRGSQKRPRKRNNLGVDVHTWAVSPDIKCVIWDVQGATRSSSDTSANFGAHPGTQSLFFSAKSLYLLVWDLASNNPWTNRRHSTRKNGGDTEGPDDNDDDDDTDEEDDEFVREEDNRQADRVLQADITNRVLSWVDCIALSGSGSAILPVALIPPGMRDIEVKRRCDTMQYMLEEHIKHFRGAAPMLLSGADNVLCVNYDDGYGIDRLQATIHAIATDTTHMVFNHVGTPVPPATVQVFDAIRRFQEEHKLILLDHLLAHIGPSIPVEIVMNALHFLSCVGEILYFGSADEYVLSRYIVLSRKWLVSALSCILRNDLKRELIETRRFMNIQCIYSNEKYTENEIIKALCSGESSSCPLLSGSDAKMLWQNMSFMREAADHYSLLSESSTSTPTMFHFLERLLVHTGVFLPLGAVSSLGSLDHSEVFFVPSLSLQAEPRDVWSFKSSDSWMTTLCHSWLFRDGAPSNLMEHLSVAVLHDLFVFSRDFRGNPPLPLSQRSHTVPSRMNSMDHFISEHEQQAIGRVRIHQIVCWKSSLLVKIGTLFADQETGKLRETFVEVYVGMSSSVCVASDAMRTTMQRVVVSGKGQVGHHGRKIWKGGYQSVLESVRLALSNYPNVDSQVVCPECLAHFNPRGASTWSSDSVLALAASGSSIVRCMRGHRVDSNLICGTTVEKRSFPDEESSHVRIAKPVCDMLASVVVVGLWDSQAGEIRSIGSGFIVDRKIGLIVTAGHVLFNMEDGEGFGSPYFGIQGAKVVIGVLPDEGGNKAFFRYFGEIVADDIQSVDACVVRITARMQHDVDDEGGGCAHQSVTLLHSESMVQEKLKSLKMTCRFELEESVRILGFNQGGEGILEQGKHVSRVADFAKGYICKTFKTGSDDSSSSDSSNHNPSQLVFAPREEIVVICPTISGHSGGPCVTDEGKVVGILSRADRVDRQRCYLVPVSEIKILVNKARKDCVIPAGSGIAHVGRKPTI